MKTFFRGNITVTRIRTALVQQRTDKRVEHHFGEILGSLNMTVFGERGTDMLISLWMK